MVVIQQMMIQCGDDSVVAGNSPIPLEVPISTGSVISFNTISLQARSISSFVGSFGSLYIL